VTPLYPQMLALTSPTGGGRSVGIVRSRTKATEELVTDYHPTCFIHFICGHLQGVRNKYTTTITQVWELFYQACMLYFISATCFDL